MKALMSTPPNPHRPPRQRQHQRWGMALWALALNLAGLGAAMAADMEVVQLSGYELQVWADARLTPQQQSRLPLWLAPLRNDSATSSEAVAASGDRARIDRGGVPVAWLDALLASQLVSSGRFAVLSTEQADPRTPSLHVRLTRYQPPHRRGAESGLWQMSQSQWSSWFDKDPQALAVSLEAEWHDPVQNRRRRLTVHADSDTCLRLPSAPAVMNEPEPLAFSEPYRHSAIGQATLAAFNRLLAWLDGMHSSQAQQIAISAVRGNRLQLQDAEQWLQVGEELPLFHRDDLGRQIGRIKIASRDQSQLEAWPLTLAAGSIRPGDVVQFVRPALSPAIEPGRQPPGSRCQPASNGSEHASAAETDASRHTEPQTEPSPAVELPQS